MRDGDNDIYVSAPMRRLQSAQMCVLKPELQRCCGTHALLLDATKGEMPPALPMLGCWARLYVDQRTYRGDLLAATSEPLPFSDDVFDLVLLRHALDVSPAASAMLVEAVRVLAPAGVLALAGVHPFSAWTPWLYWQARGRSIRLSLPSQLQRVLRREGLEIELAQRVGRSWPGLEALDSKARNVFGGGYVLTARKCPRMAVPRRIRSAQLTVAASGQLAPGTRRSSAMQTTEDA